MIRAVVGSKYARGLVLSLGASGLVVCASAAQIKPYRIPKEKESASAPSVPAPGAPKEVVAWTTPAGWEEMPPGEMRLASFKVKAEDGRTADVSIIPLPGLAGSDLENVNRWRGQVAMPPVKEEELAGLGEKVEIAGVAAQLYDMAGQPAGAPATNRILAAIQRREGVVFFHKMVGEDRLVLGQKPAFVSFLKSIRFQTSEPAPGALPPSHPPVGGMSPQPALPGAHPPVGGTPVGEGAAAGDNKPAWKVPAGWQEQPPGQMQMARFLVAGKDEAKTEASVAVIPGDGGGALANVNRWRRQIGLGPIEAADLGKETSTLAVVAVQTMVLDATSSDGQKRLIAVSVPRDGNTWFYKLTGDPAVVGREKQALIGFIQSNP